ncbi:MAG: hypothetical protein K2N51_21035 [Lachnospiraceae bacterium]|nr:hypothetical protein [Lachnospiraceae bacterium]
MYLKEEKAWDFLNDESLKGPFDDLANTITKFNITVFVLIASIIILYFLIKKVLPIFIKKIKK